MKKLLAIAVLGLSLAGCSTTTCSDASALFSNCKDRCITKGWKCNCEQKEKCCEWKKNSDQKITTSVPQ